MTKLDNIKNIFENHTPRPYEAKPPSAVLVPLMEIDGEIHVIFTQRALHMVFQPGDICFPGGHHENNETPAETALRETYEELGVRPENIEIFGQPDYLLTKYGAYVIPFVGLIKNTKPEDFVINPDEVERVITIPLKFFMETEPMKSSMTLNREFPEDFPYHLIYGGKNYKWGQIKEYHLFYTYEDVNIWGLTAKIIRNTAEILKANGF